MAMTKLGSYQLLRPIGQGGMGEIWLAEQVGPGGFKRPAVVKRLKESLTDEDEFLEMFLEEARLAALIHHPNVVSVFEFAREGDTYFLAMEYVNGITLRSLLKLARQKGELLPEPIIASIAVQALQGLAAAHELVDEHGQPLHLVHRDISPDNIMVAFDGMVKVLDFGIAKARTSAAQTRVGTMKGKLSYMPPEAALGQPLDARADLWSMGVVLYEAVTQRRPFAADNDAAVYAAVVNADPLPPLGVNPTTSLAFDSIIRMALAKSPDDRPPTARAFAETLLQLPGVPVAQRELGEFIREFVGEATESKPPRPAAAAPEVSDRYFMSFSGSHQVSQAWWWALLALVAVFALGALALWQGGAFETPREHEADLAFERATPDLPKVDLRATPPARLDGSTTWPEVDSGASAAALEAADSGAREALAVAPTPVDAGPEPVKVVEKERPAGRGTFLEIRATPWADITLDGKSLGPTPLGAVRVRPGNHVLVLSNPQLKKRRVVQVNVEAGKTKRVAVDLD